MSLTYLMNTRESSFPSVGIRGPPFPEKQNTTTEQQGQFLPPCREARSPEADRAPPDRLESRDPFLQGLQQEPAHY